MDSVAIFEAVRTYVSRTGLFEQVDAYQPKNAPGAGRTAAVWLVSVASVQASGLASSTARVELAVRVYIGAEIQPPERVEYLALEATDALMNAFTGAFTLGGTINLREVDVLGAHGEPLSMTSGYVDFSGAWYRAATITLPLIINDAWTQAP